MAIVKTFDVVCDYTDPDSGEDCLAWEHGVTGRAHVTAPRARASARSGGWVHRKGRDFCPVHAET